MSGNLKVSIVIPSYSRPRLVVDAIESVFDQDLADWELIVADDGSNDETLCAIETALRGDPRTKLVRNAGAVMGAGDRGEWSRCSPVVNAGLREATGEYVCSICDDDYLLAGSLAVRAQALDDHPEVHVVYGRLRSISYDAAGDWDSSADPRAGRIALREDGFDPATGKQVNPATWEVGLLSPIAGRLDHNQVMWRRVCLAEMGGPPWWPHVRMKGEPADAAFFARLDKLGHAALAVDHYVCTKRYHGRSLGRVAGNDTRRE